MDSPELSRELALQDACTGSIGPAGHAFHGRPLGRRQLYADPLWSIDGQVSFADRTIRRSEDLFKADHSQDPADCSLFPQEPKSTTACIGKWHLGMNWVEVKKGKSEELPIGARMTDGPNALGFDYFYGFTHARNIGGIIEQDTVVANVKSIENQPMMIKKALEYLDARAKEDIPFFLYFPVCPPHSPIVPGEEFVGKSGMQGQGRQIRGLGLSGRPYAGPHHGGLGAKRAG